MRRFANILLVSLAIAPPVQAQVFDRQFTATDTFSNDDGGQRSRAFRTFVGRHAFAGQALPVVGFFGCNAQGGGECLRGPAKHDGFHNDMSGGTDEAAGGFDDAGGASCP